MAKHYTSEIIEATDAIFARWGEFSSRREAARELYRLTGDHFSSDAAALSYLQREDEKRRTKGEGGSIPRKKKEKKEPSPDREEFKLNAWSPEGHMMDIEEYCEHHGLPRDDIRSYKLVSHTGTPYYNIYFREHLVVGKELTEEQIEEIFKRHACPPVDLPQIEPRSATTKAFDRLIYTDTHIGMDPDENGHALYGGTWTEEDIMASADRMVAEVVRRQTGSLLHIDELGDVVDGWDGETVRKGHSLPQNLDNEGQFDVSVTFKMRVLEGVVPYYKRIVCHNATNDNHAGAFGYTVNSCFKMLAEAKYPDRVEVHNYRAFIDHYFVGDHCFLLCHGKDSKHLKFGFKAQADLKGMEKIEDYIKANDIYAHAKYIEFSKGDSHQLIFDMSTSDSFSYMSYPALAPSSEWIQTNFKKGRRGFVIQNVLLNHPDKNITPIFF